MFAHDLGLEGSFGADLARGEQKSRRTVSRCGGRAHYLPPTNCTWAVGPGHVGQLNPQLGLRIVANRQA